MVEDCKGDVDLVCMALEAHGMEGELNVIVDGERAILHIEAIAMQREVGPDLVILDLNLPRKSGRDVLAALRETPWGSAVPVAILSSSGAPRDRADATALGATAYFRKPSRLQEYLELGAAFRQMLTKA